MASHTGRTNTKLGPNLRELKGNNDLPWVVIGDFNEIAFSHDKDGGMIAPQAICRRSVKLSVIVG
jgi:hypothetical protein